MTLQSIGDAVITTDSQGIVDTVNPVAESLTGWNVDDPIDLATVKSINEIAQAMGKKTIAEFVENEAIFATLKQPELNVDFAQGYYVGDSEHLDTLMFGDM